jgi:hypothetical protein
MASCVFAVAAAAGKEEQFRLSITVSPPVRLSAANGFGVNGCGWPIVHGQSNEHTVLVVLGWVYACGRALVDGLVGRPAMLAALYGMRRSTGLAVAATASTPDGSLAASCALHLSALPRPYPVEVVGV